jgi:hypothetical protein
MENPEYLTEKLSAIEGRPRELFGYISTVRKDCLTTISTTMPISSAWQKNLTELLELI